MADGLDVVAVRVEDEGAVVAGVVDRPQTGGAVVGATRGQGGGVEGVDLLDRANAEGDVSAADRRPAAPIDPEERFGPCSVSLPKPAAPSNSISSPIASGSRTPS